MLKIEKFRGFKKEKKNKKLKTLKGFPKPDFVIICETFLFLFFTKNGERGSNELVKFWIASLDRK